MRMPLRDAAALAAAVLAPFLVALALVPARTGLTETNLALLLVVVVVAVAALGNRWAGALAALSAAFWYDFFLAAPYYSLRIHGRADVETAILLLLVGLIVSQLAAHGRLLGAVALRDARHLERLHTTNRLAETSRSPDDLARVICSHLVELLGLADCRFEYGTLLGRPPRLRPDGTVQVDGWIWDLERQGWPEGPVELRAVAGGHYQGRFLLTLMPGAPAPSLEARLVAVDLAGRAAAALAATARPPCPPDRARQPVSSG
ncbi:DUF4118 domain-containing protein [Streptomyces sp. NPDC048718]|uniref:DUF4118 domain-containing protein n=1 Tax=Streptomyces sp. NPDC048718 TaxID=3365587 RepID=UPI003722813A